MNSKVCPDCGRPLIPAPARFEGQDTFCGFMPCVCSWCVYLDQKEPGESFEEYRARVNLDICSRNQD